MISSHNIVPIAADTNYEDWVQLFDAYLTLLSVDLPDADKARLFGRLIKENGKLRGFLLLSPEKEAIGFAHYIYHEDTWHPQPLCYLDDIFVQPACRRQGGGLALINAVKAAAEREGCRRLYWMTEKGNKARSLYDKVAESTKVVYRIKL
jgi:GNAT superfamily N-acetyltransferase